jgi:ribosomal protein L11 methyltransferase
MALELLEQAMECLRGEERPPSLLDVGTGTGVLAIAGKALGSGFTVAFDPDPAAVCAAGRNFQLNGLWSRQSTSGQSPCLFVGGIEAVGPRFDLVLVNLVAPVLLRLLDPLAERVDRGLILSGIADPMAERTFTAFGRAGLRMTSRLSRDGWNAALLVTETWE